MAKSQRSPDYFGANKKWLISAMLVLSLVYIMTFNYGGCGGGGGGGSSGSSVSLISSDAVTKPATNVTNNSATLNGTINLNKGINISVCFDFGTTISYGSTTGYQAIGSGTTPVTITATITGLSPNTTYNFRVRAIAGTGGGTGIVSNGDNLTFTTTAPPPTCTTDPADNISTTSARLNGTINPNGFDTTAYFNYGLTTSYTVTVTTTAQAVGGAVGAIAVTSNISGLSSSTIYNFRVVGVNSNGTSYGDNRVFTTGAPIGSAPTCTTDGADNVTYNSARLNGTVNPNGLDTNTYFQWGTSVSYGNTTTSQSIGSGITSIAVLAAITGLSGNTPYNFRVVGTNSTGTTNGNNLTFASSPPPPTCVTNPATNITYNSATLNGTVGANGATTTVYFQWGTNTSYGTNTTSQLTGGAIGAIAFTADISGLSGNTIYNFRVVGTSSAGTTYGNNLTFTTLPPPPTCVTQVAANVTYNSATLNGTVNPNGLSTDAYFQWGRTLSYGTDTATQSIGGAIGAIAVTADISGLSASLQYSFRVVGTNSSGTTYGDNLTFITAAPPPTCTTDPADNVSTTSARLNGTVNPNGSDTQGYFQWGLDTSYGNTTTSQAIDSGTTNVPVTAGINGLSITTLYNFRCVATNSSGTTNGNNLTFTTTALPPPTCTTQAATNVSTTSATLNGTVNPNELNVTACYFQYGTTSYATDTSNVSPLPGNGATGVAVSINITGLTANTTYNYYRVVATNAGGTTNGNNLTFITTAVSLPAQVGSPNPANGATNVPTNQQLSWGPASGATSYNVYFGTTLPGSPNSSNQSGTSYNPGTLSNNTTYYWRIDSVNAGGTTTGVVWSFTTATGGGGGETAVDDYCWVVNLGSANVTRITKSTLATTTIAVGANPLGVAVDATYCWITNYFSDNVTRILKSDLSTTTIVVGDGPVGVAVDETYCWVANYLTDNVTRITKSTLATTTIAVGTNPYGVAVDGTYCWVTNWVSDNVTRITKSTLATTTIAVGTNPIGVAVDETYCWVANQNSDNVTRITKSTLATTTIGIGAGINPTGVAVDETYCWGTANYNPQSIFAIRKSDFALFGIPTGSTGPAGSSGVSVDGDYVWVVPAGTGSVVTRITKATNATTQITVGTNPYSLGDMTGYAYDNYANQ